MRRGGPATLEPEDAALPVQDSDNVPATEAPRVDRSFMASRAANAASPARPAAATRPGAPIDAARRLVTDYGYVIGELQRIFITAAIIVVALIVIALLRH